MLLLQVTVFKSVRNIDNRPFKALVVGSSPTQPKVSKIAFLLANCPWNELVVRVRL